MNALTKDQVVVMISVIILLFTAMINWNIYSWLILVAIIMIVTAWYIKNACARFDKLEAQTWKMIRALK